MNHQVVVIIIVFSSEYLYFRIRFYLQMIATRQMQQKWLSQNWFNNAMFTTHDWEW